MLRIGIVLGLILTCATVGIAWAGGKESSTFPADYWNRQFGFMQYARIVSVVLEVESAQKAERSIDRLLGKLDGHRVASQPLYNPSGNQVTNLSYELPLSKCDAAGEKLIDLGTLQSFNTQDSQIQVALPQVKEMLAALDAEMSENASALAHMPIAAYFLSTKKTELAHVEETMLQSAHKCLAQVRFTVKAPGGTP